MSESKSAVTATAREMRERARAHAANVMERENNQSKQTMTLKLFVARQRGKVGVCARVCVVVLVAAVRAKKFNFLSTLTRTNMRIVCLFL